MANPIIYGAAMIAFDGNKVLLVKHGPKSKQPIGRYGLPSGRQDHDEEIKQTAIREFSEETGLAADTVTDFPGNFFTADITMRDGKVYTCPWTVFLCKQYTGQLKATEETVPEWVEINTLSGLDLLPNVETAITNALKFLKK